MSFITWCNLIALKAGTNFLPSSVSRKHMLVSVTRDAKYVLLCARTSFQLPTQLGWRCRCAQTFSKLYTSTSICITNNSWELTTSLISSTLKKKIETSTIHMQSRARSTRACKLSLTHFCLNEKTLNVVIKVISHLISFRSETEVSEVSLLSSHFTHLARTSVTQYWVAATWYAQTVVLFIVSIIASAHCWDKPSYRRQDQWFLSRTHTNEFSLENAYFSMRLSLPSTPTHWAFSSKTYLLENALENGTKRRRKRRVENA